MNPVRGMDDVKTITHLEPEKSVGFVGEALGQLRQEVGNNATVLGFVGAPFTLASYIVEGGTSTHYKVIKKMAFDSRGVPRSPRVHHRLCDRVRQVPGGQRRAGGADLRQLGQRVSPGFREHCLPYLSASSTR